MENTRELPTLDVVSHGQSSLPNGKSINDCPPELLEQIFLYLTPKQQRTCRQVCKYWFNIQRASPNVDHTLNLSKVLEPIEISFNYNLINFNATTFDEYQDLTEFWEKVGSEVKEICINYKLASICSLESKTGNQCRKTGFNGVRSEYYVDFIGAAKTGFRVEHFPKMTKFTVKDLRQFYMLLHHDIPEWKALLNQVENFSVSFQFLNPHNHYEFSISNVTELTVKTPRIEVTEEFFQRISFPKLTTLIILNAYPDIGIELTHLFEIKLDFSQIKTLFVGNYSSLDDNGLKFITKKFPNIECLIFFVKKNIPDLMVKNMFEKLLYFKDFYLVVYTQSKVDYISFHRTDYGIEQSNKKCRAFDDVSNQALSLISDREVINTFNSYCYC